MFRKLFFLLAFNLLAVFAVSAQTNNNLKKDTLKVNKLDTLKPAAYVNVGKIAARKAVIQSAILPGLGQLNNKVNVWSIGKVALIYGGFTALTLSYIDNTKSYNIFLDELKYRQEHNNESPPGSIYAGYPTQGLYTAKDVYRRNREVVIFGYVGVYALNLIDAYVSTRLRYFNITEDLAIKISPATIQTNTLFAHENVPALKLSLKL